MTDETAPREVPQKQRRRSFLDAGGVNLINNFALLYTRAQLYMGLTLLEGDLDLSPTSTATSEEPLLPPSPQQPTQGHNHIKTFSFPEAQRRRSSVPEYGATDFDDVELVRTLYLIVLPLGNLTAPQTLFNSVNTLIGIGMLLLPFALHLAGWVVGVGILATSAVATCITAVVLGGIIRMNPQFKTYGDIAYAYGGRNFALAVTFLFMLDLTGATLSLIILFADCFHTVVPVGSYYMYKLLVVVAVFVLLFIPLSILSMLSALGIVCTLAIITIILWCGFMLHDTPGSLLVPAVTNVWPVDFRSFLLSLGLFLSVWGGHPVFPELYRDMRHPAKFSHVAHNAFGITFAIDGSFALIGFLMFGIKCKDLIIKNLLANPNYPHWLNPLLCVFMGLLPVSKLPLITKPIITVYETFFKLNTLDSAKGRPHYTPRRVAARFVFCVVLFVISLLFNSFGQVVLFLGLAICFTICIVLPSLFYLRFYDDITWVRRWAAYVAVVVGTAGAIGGTYASITMNLG